jgi:hypothetical protein
MTTKLQGSPRKRQTHNKSNLRLTLDPPWLRARDPPRRVRARPVVQARPQRSCAGMNVRRVCAPPVPRADAVRPRCSCAPSALVPSPAPFTHVTVARILSRRTVCYPPALVRGRGLAFAQPARVSPLPRTRAARPSRARFPPAPAPRARSAAHPRPLAAGCTRRAGHFRRRTALSGRCPRSPKCATSCTAVTVRPARAPDPRAHRRFPTLPRVSCTRARLGAATTRPRLDAAPVFSLHAFSGRRCHRAHTPRARRKRIRSRLGLAHRAHPLLVLLSLCARVPRVRNQSASPYFSAVYPLVSSTLPQVLLQ